MTSCGAKKKQPNPNNTPDPMKMSRTINKRKPPKTLKTVMTSHGAKTRSNEDASYD